MPDNLCLIVEKYSRQKLKIIVHLMSVGAVYYDSGMWWIGHTKLDGDEGISDLAHAKFQDDEMEIIGNIHEGERNESVQFGEVY